MIYKPKYMCCCTKQRVCSSSPTHLHTHPHDHPCDSHHPSTLSDSPHLVPITFNQVRPVRRHSPQKPLRPKKPNRPPQRMRILPLEPKLGVHDPQRKQSRQRVVQHLPVGAVQLRDRGQDERHGHALEEVGVAAGLDQERVGGVVGGVIVEAIADVFVVLDSLVNDAVGEKEEVGGEGEGPGAGDSCEGLVV